jgi:hypothetical protein
LIAFERGDQRLLGVLRKARAIGARICIPASALAQVWRGGARSAALARLIDAAEVDSLTVERAREVGLRLGTRAQSDITDAHVVCCAIERSAAIATSDPADMESLAAPGEKVVAIAI